MIFKPVNRYIHIKLQTEKPKERETSILLPADYTEQSDDSQRHAIVEVIESAPDVRLSTIGKGALILVDRSMIEKITIKNETITVILDNYVVGIIE